MANINNQNNMVLYPGFPEVPNDAFDIVPLRRTYKSVCPKCKCRTHTHTINNRVKMCNECFSITIQKIRRGVMVRRQLHRVIHKDLLYRWCMTNKVSGYGISNLLMKYI